jgi:cAMP phosphodiesterase
MWWRENHIIGVLAEKVLNNHFAMVLTKDQASLHYNTKQINPKKFFSVLVNLLKISLYVMDHITQNKS